MRKKRFAGRVTPSVGRNLRANSVASHRVSFRGEPTRFLCDCAALFENPPAWQLLVKVFSLALLSSDASDGEGGLIAFFCFFTFFYFFFFFLYKKRFFLKKKRHRRLVFFGKIVRKYYRYAVNPFGDT